MKDLSSLYKNIGSAYIKVAQRTDSTELQILYIKRCLDNFSSAFYYGMEVQIKEWKENILK